MSKKSKKIKLAEAWLREFALHSIVRCYECRRQLTKKTSKKDEFREEVLLTPLF